MDRIGARALGKFAAEATEAILADEGQACEALEFELPLGPLQSAGRRLLIRVAVENDREPRGRRDHRRRRQMVLDHGDIDAAPLEALSDRPGLGEIAAEGDVVDGLDFDALERLVHLRADDQRRARIAARAYEVAHAKLDRRRAFRPE